MKPNPPRARTIKAKMRKGSALAERKRSVAASKKREKQIRKARDSRLVGARAHCAADRAKATRKCASRRDRIRGQARSALEGEKQARERARRRYAELTGGAIPDKKAKRLTKAESDSLAEHSIPTNLISLWRRERRSYPLSMTPDERALAFLDWADRHPQDVEEARIKHFEDEYTDAYFASLEAERYSGAQAEAVPF